MNTTQATAQVTVRSAFLGLAAAATFTLLSGLSHIADAQVDAAQMARSNNHLTTVADATPAAQTVVIVGKRLPQA